MSLRITLAGATGWVGKALVAAIAASDDLVLAGAVSRSAAGRDAGEAAGLPRLGVPISASLEEALRQPSDVVIDYTKPNAVKAHALTALAHGMIGDCYIQGAGVSADPDVGFSHYLLAAEYGNAKAAYNVGLAYDQGMFGQAVDRDEAKRFYRMAADGGEASAMTRLAVLYMTDQDPPDEVTIVDLLEAAVEQGDEDAEEILQNLRDEILP